MMLKNKEFITKITSEIRMGHGISLFVGSGISAPSGIMMGMKFENYIAYTMYKVLRNRSWDIRRSGWPNFPNLDEVKKARRFLSRELSEILKQRYGTKCEIDQHNRLSIDNPSRGKPLKDIQLKRPLIPNFLSSDKQKETEKSLYDLRKKLGVENCPDHPHYSKSSSEFIRDQAIRSLWSWNSALEFFSQICVDPERKKRELDDGIDEERDFASKCLYLSEPESFVIDSFNTYITRGKKPNLIHNMISRLSRSLRTQVILTTNFDTLIEESFSRLNDPIYPLSVSIKGNIPSFSTVRAQLSLVKLHGDMLETRADTSIDDEPDRVDVSRFFSYLRGPELSHRKQPKDFIQSQLMVIGYSASDARCIKMIKHVLDYDEDFKVYWVCYSEYDCEKIQSVFREYISQDYTQVFVTRTERSDLLLWELYQQLNMSLPGGGFSFQFSHDVPPQPQEETDSDINDSGQIKLLITLLFNENTRPKQCRNYDDLIGALQETLSKESLTTLESASGVAMPMKKLFSEMGKRFLNPIWIEMEDYRDGLQMVLHIYQIIAIRLGYFQLNWSNITPPKIWENKTYSGFPEGEDLDLLVKHLKNYGTEVNFDPADYTLFLYGRNGPGGCVGLDLSYWGTQQDNTPEKVINLLRGLDFRVISIPYERVRHERNNEKSKYVSKLISEYHKKPNDKEYKVWKEEQLSHLDLGSEKEFIDVPCNLSKGNQTLTLIHEKSYEHCMAVVLNQFLGWHPQKQPREVDRTIWLYAMTLFRKSRHSSAMISESAIPSPNNYNASNLNDWEEGDNDVIRWGKVFSKSDADDQIGWAAELAANSNLFLFKPGGYSWKYRDTRLGLHSILNEVSGLNLKSKKKRLASLWKLKPRIHYWIGDWYLRAYYATGHYSPLVEALYHTHQTICNARYYETYIGTEDSEDEIDEMEKSYARARLMWRAIIQYKLILGMASRCLRFWAPGTNVFHTFFAISELGDKKNVGDGCYWKDINAKYKDNFKTEHKNDILTEINKRIEAEIASLPQMIRNLQHVVLTEAKTIPIAPRGRAFSYPLSASQYEIDLSRTYHSQFPYFIPPEKEGEEEDIDVKSFEDFIQLNKLSKQLECKHQPKCPYFELISILDGRHDILKPNEGINKKDREKIIRNEVSNLCIALNGKNKRCIIELWNRTSLPDEKGKCEGDRMDEELKKLIFIIFEIAFFAMRRAKFLDQAKGHSRFFDETFGLDETHKNTDYIWIIVTGFCYLALSLSRYLSVPHLSDVVSLRIQVLTLYGLGLAKLRRFSEAHRRLNEAHALISRGLGLSDSDELAKVHLRRAEVEIQIAVYHRRLFDKYRATNGDNAKKEIRLSLSHVDDAWNSLEKAEAVLAGSSHSTEWWERLCNIKLHCYAMLGSLKYRDSSMFETGNGASARRSCLPFRKRVHFPTTLLSLYRQIELLSSNDSGYRALRSCHYIAVALNMLEGSTSCEYRTLTSILKRKVMSESAYVFKDYRSVVNEDIKKCSDVYKAIESAQD